MYKKKGEYCTCVTVFKTQLKTRCLYNGLYKKKYIYIYIIYNAENKKRFEDS